MFHGEHTRGAQLGVHSRHHHAAPYAGDRPCQVARTGSRIARLKLKVQLLLATCGQDCSGWHQQSVCLLSCPLLHADVMPALPRQRCAQAHLAMHCLQLCSGMQVAS